MWMIELEGSALSFCGDMGRSSLGRFLRYFDDFHDLGTGGIFESGTPFSCTKKQPTVPAAETLQILREFCCTVVL